MAVGKCELIDCITPSMPWSRGAELLQPVSMEGGSTPQSGSPAVGPFVWPDDDSACGSLDDRTLTVKDLGLSSSAGADDELARQVGSILLTILEDDSSSDSTQHSSCLSDDFRKRFPSDCTGSFSPLCGSYLLSGVKSTSPEDKLLPSGIIGDGSPEPVAAVPDTFLSDSSSSSFPPVVEQLVRLQMTQTASRSNNGDTWSSSKSSTDCILSDCFPPRSHVPFTGGEEPKSELMPHRGNLKPCIRSPPTDERQQPAVYPPLTPPFEESTPRWSSDNRWYSTAHLNAKAREPLSNKNWSNRALHSWLPLEKDNRNSFCAQTSFDSGICEDISWSVPCHQVHPGGARSPTDYSCTAAEIPFRPFMNHGLEYGMRPVLRTPDDWSWQEGYRTRVLSPPTLASSAWSRIPFCCEFPPLFPQPWFQMASCSRPLPPSAKFMRRNNGAAIELHFNLEECSEEYRLLEKERKKTEADLARNNLGKKINSSNNLPVPRLPPAPTKIDRIVVDFFREHARVVTLLQKMEWLRSEPLSSVIVEAVRAWFNAIRAVHVYRTNERAYLFYAQGRIRYNEDRNMLQMANLLKILTRCVRRARAAMACALTLTVNRELNSQQQDEVNSFLSSKETPPVGTAELKPKPVGGNPPEEEKVDVQMKNLPSGAMKKSASDGGV